MRVLPAVEPRSISVVPCISRYRCVPSSPARQNLPNTGPPQETPILSVSRSLSTAIFALFFASATLSVSGRSALAQTLQAASEQADLIQPSLAYSSSMAPTDPSEALPDAPVLTDQQLVAPQPKLVKQRSFAPFHRLGIAVTGGTGATGLEIATSMGYHFNLRASGNYFSYFADFSTEGYNVTGSIITRNANLSLDYYPFRNSGFRISPGVTLDNGNTVHGNLNIPAGQTFDLGETTYTSGSDGTDGNPVGYDPINGTIGLSFGRKVAPSMTVGWGNLIPRGRHHWSIPFEIGFEYIGAPLIDFNIQGIGCQPNQGCGSIDDPANQANIQAEKTKLNNDIYPLRFFPIMSIGFGYSW